MADFNITLDVDKQSIVPQAVRDRVGDAEGCKIIAEITKDGEPYSLSGLTVRFECLLPDGSAVRDSGVSVSGSKVTFNVPIEVVRARGLVKTAYFRIMKGTAFIDSTESFIIDVKPGVKPCDVEVPDKCVPELDEALAAIKQQTSVTADFTNDAEAAEAARASAEKTRQSNETTRKNQETARVNAEKQRVTEFNTLKSQSQAATTAAQSAASNANSAANYAQTVADGLSQSVIGDEDVAAMKAQIDKLGSMIANATGKFFYMDGTIYAPSSKASVSGSTIKLADTCSVSGTTINLA